MSQPSEAAISTARKIQRWAENISCLNESREENILAQAKMIDEALAAHRARIKALEGKLYNIAALGIVYAYPDDWSCATEGGSPEIQDYQRIDIALLAQKE